MSAKNQKLNLNKDTLYDLYINQQMTSKEVAEIFGCTSKSIRNWLIKFGIPVRQNGEAVKLERSKWSTEKEQARSKKFMQTWLDTPEEQKHQMTQNRTKNINSPEAIAKAKETKLINGTYKVSQAENKFYEQLLLMLSKEDIIRGYIDKERYPFNCDFYIKSKDLFIEYQGHQTHGYEPYDPNDLVQQEYLELMQKRGQDMRTWTARDPKKLKIALNNKISLLLIYPKDDSYLVKNGTIKSIGKFNVLNINDIE